MSPHPPESIPGLEVPAPEPPEAGPVELGLRRQIEVLRQQEILTDAHAAWEAHALSTARDIDFSDRMLNGRPSGRAALRDSFTKILEAMPAPEVVQSSDLDKVLAAVFADEDTNAET